MSRALYRCRHVRNDCTENMRAANVSDDYFVHDFNKNHTEDKVFSSTNARLEGRAIRISK